MSTNMNRNENENNQEEFEKARSEYVRWNKYADVVFIDFINTIEYMESRCRNYMIERFEQTGEFQTNVLCTGTVQSFSSDPEPSINRRLFKRLNTMFPNVQITPCHSCTEFCHLNSQVATDNAIKFQIMPEHYGLSNMKQKN